MKLLIDTIHEQIEKREIVSNVISLDILTTIIGELTSNQQDLIEESIQLIDAFQTPQLDFNEISKTYSMYVCLEFRLLEYVVNKHCHSTPKSPNESLESRFGDANSRASLFRRRLLFIRDRLIRSGDFKLRGAIIY